MPSVPGCSVGSVPLVVGLGNSLAADDSVGVELVRLLRRETGLGCDLLELGDAGLKLLDLFQNRTWILFIDAVSSGLAPGTIHLIPLPSAEIESKHFARFSSHGLGLREVLELCHALGRRVPAVMLLGIEVASTNYGDARSAAVEQALQVLASRFLSLVQLLNRPASGLWRETHRHEPGSDMFPNCAEVARECDQSAHRVSLASARES